MDKHDSLEYDVKRRITNIRAKIINGVQRFIFVVEKELKEEYKGVPFAPEVDNIILSPYAIEENTNINLGEIEILIGSKLTYNERKLIISSTRKAASNRHSLCGLSYYSTNLKERQKISHHIESFKELIKIRENNYLQDFSINYLCSKEKMRELNRRRLNGYNFKKIKKVFIRNKTVGLDLGGKELVFVPSHLLMKQTNLYLNELNILEDSYITLSYEYKGDIITTTEHPPRIHVVKETRLRGINLRMSERVDSYRIEKIENACYSSSNSKYYDNDYNWLGDACGESDYDAMSTAYWNID